MRGVSYFFIFPTVEIFFSNYVLRKSPSLYQSVLLGLLHKQLHERLALIGHLAVQHSILERLLQRSHLRTGAQMEHFHDFPAIYTRLEESLVVAHLQVGNLLAHQAEIVKEVLLAYLVLAGNVGFAKCHQVVYIIAGIIQKSTHSAVGHFLI